MSLWEWAVSIFALIVMAVGTAWLVTDYLAWRSWRKQPKLPRVEQASHLRLIQGGQNDAA